MLARVSGRAIERRKLPAWRSAPVRKVRVQVFAAGQLERAEMFVDFNPYLFRGEAEGALVGLED